VEKDGVDEGDGGFGHEGDGGCGHEGDGPFGHEDGGGWEKIARKGGEDALLSKRTILTQKPDRTHSETFDSGLNNHVSKAFSDNNGANLS
jgi:hypothetical protein